MWSNKKVFPSDDYNNTDSTTAENTQLEGNNTLITAIPPNNNNNINVIVKQSTLALEVDIIINNGEGGNTIYKLRGSTLDWLMLVDCDFGRLGKFVIMFMGLWFYFFFGEMIQYYKT